jgi:hypothetical protein
MPETFRVNMNGAEPVVKAEGSTPLLYAGRIDLACQ